MYHFMYYYCFYCLCIHNFPGINLGFHKYYNYQIGIIIPILYMGELQLKKTETLIWSEMASVPVAQSHSEILPRSESQRRACRGAGAGVVAHRKMGHELRNDTCDCEQATQPFTNFHFLIYKMGLLRG